jgi:Domain of unknown function (DUF4337)
MSHAHHEPHAESGSEHKKIAILISVLAALLAIVETAGKNAQTQYLSHQVEASNLWAFYQAKTIRRTVVATAADRLEVDRSQMPVMASEGGNIVDKRIAAWRADVDRWESEPETGEGRRELTARAQSQEKLRDDSSRRYHLFEYGSAALQLAIVLASASIVTGLVILAWGAIGLGGLGSGFALWAWLGPALF